MSLIGDLTDTKIADVLRLFATGRKTGRLTVSSEEDQTVLRFQKGAIVHAHRTGGKLHGEVAILDLFGWKQGQLTFILEEKAVTANVTRSVDQVILDGLRMGDAFHRTRELIPSDQVVFQIGAAPKEDSAPYGVGAIEWRVLRLVDGVRDVREILETSGVPRPEVLRILLETTERGFLEKVEPQRELRVQTQGIFGKDVAEMDDRLDGEWRRLHRFGRGVLRIEVRSAAGRSVTLPAHFRGSLGRGVHLPRAAVAELQVKDGDDVRVRPVG
jgi:hypothetical protein